MNRFRRTRDGLTMLMMTLTMLVSVAGFNLPLRAAGKAHYIAVASDRHSTEDAIKIAMCGMPDSVEYVCLNGDMANSQRRSGSGVTGIKITPGKNTIALSWKKDKKAAFYLVRYSAFKSMKQARTLNVSGSKLSCKIKKLKSGKKYYIMIRPIVKKKGVIYQGAYCKQRTAITKQEPAGLTK